MRFEAFQAILRVKKKKSSKKGKLNFVCDFVALACGVAPLRATIHFKLSCLLDSVHKSDSLSANPITVLWSGLWGRTN